MKTLIVSSLGEETIEGGKLFKGGNYMRKYGIWNFQAFMNSKRIVAAATIWGITVPMYLYTLFLQGYLEVLKFLPK